MRKKYLAAAEWRGRLTIDTMRIFDTLKKARKYVYTMEDYHFRVYEVDDQENRLVLSPAKLEKEGFVFKRTGPLRGWHHKDTLVF